MLMYGRNQHNILKQLSSNLKKIEKIVGEGIQVIISKRRMLNKLTGKLNMLSWKMEDVEKSKISCKEMKTSVWDE